LADSPEKDYKHMDEVFELIWDLGEKEDEEEEE
jgi:hypothetical protein